jgi:hypothetical protein
LTSFYNNIEETFIFQSYGRYHASKRIKPSRDLLACNEEIDGMSTNDADSLLEMLVQDRDRDAISLNGWINSTLRNLKIGAMDNSKLIILRVVNPDASFEPFFVCIHFFL